MSVLVIAVIAPGMRLTATLLVALLSGALAAPGCASASASAPYFSALPASGATELQTARWGAVAAPLPNGEVLIAGGVHGSSTLQSAELFNPASDTFTALPASGSTELQSAREDAVAAPLPNGQVLITGGRNGNGVMQSAELFDPASGTFTALPASGSTELQSAREDAVAAPLPNGQVLIAGGSNEKSGTMHSAELFDPASGAFTALPASGNTELQSARRAAVAAPLPNGQVLIAGGSDSGGSFLQSGELFDPASGTFTALPASGSTELQTVRYSPVAALLPNGQVLIAGGYDGSSSDLQSAELFDPASGTFTALPASGSTELQGARFRAVAALLPNGQVLIAGGLDQEVEMQSAELYSPAPEVAAAGGDFGDQTVGEPSSVSVVVATNIGAQALSISASSLGGANPADFQITADACSGRTLAFEQSCTISTRFTPSRTGTREATIALADNEPSVSTITLTGNAVAANSGPPGTNGTNGSNGTPGAVGQRGTAGVVELVTCKQVTTGKGKHKKAIMKCTTRLTGSPIKFTSTGAVTAAVLTRGSVVYATGTAIRTGIATRLLLTRLQKIRAGRYTLTLTHGRHRQREMIMIG